MFDEPNYQLGTMLDAKYIMTNRTNGTNPTVLTSLLVQPNFFIHLFKDLALGSQYQEK